MKKMKKLFAVLLTLAMVMGMTTIGMAAPAAETMPTAKVTVKNVVKGATLHAYQIIRYNLNGQFEDVVTSKPIQNMKEPTAAEITERAKLAGTASLPEKTGLTWTYAANPGEGATEGSYETAALDAGMWLILITGSNDTIYNPMIVSVNVDTDSTGHAVAGEVDAAGNFIQGSVTGYAKSSKPTVTKKATNYNFQLDENIQFEIEAQIPAYNSNYTAVQYVITDELSDNLMFNQNTVKISWKDAAEGSEFGYTLTPAFSGQTMTINATAAANAKGDDGSYTNAGRTIVVKYTAKLTDAAKAALNENVNLSTNNVKVKYTNNPNKADDTTEQTTDTEQYTFGINAKAEGSDTETTKNFIKTDDGEVKEVEGVSTKVYTELAGATFAVYTKKVDADGNPVTGSDGKPQYEKVNSIAAQTTGANGNSAGIASFTGLKANTEYFLHEESAPSGYKVSDEYVRVYINAAFDTNNKLTGYTIQVGEGEHAASTEYTWTNQGGSVVKGDEKGYEFHNTKLAELPSTGGIGTTIFTIGGCLIMILAAALFFASRRKSVK